MSQYDYDWIVVGSGFGGSVSALRLAEKGYTVAVLECGKRFTRRGLPEVDLGPAPLLLGAAARACAGSSASPPSRTSPSSAAAASAAAASATPTRSTSRRRSSSRTRSGPTSPTGSASWRPHYAEAQRMLGVAQVETDDPADELLREYGEQIGVGDTYQKTPVGVYFGEPGQDRPRPLLRRRGPRPHRLHALRPLHGRLPARRQEHAGQELPLAGRAARRRDRSPTAP